MSIKNLSINYKSKTRGQHLILLGLLLVAVPLIQKHFLNTSHLYTEVGFLTSAVLFIVLGIWRIIQNISYSFSIDSNLVRQEFSGHPKWNFSVNLRDIRDIKKANGSSGTLYYLIMDDNKRYPIPRVQDNNPEKIIRKLEQHLKS